MKQARGLFLTVFLTLILLAGVLPANAAPEGQMTWAVHVSLAPTWFDPAETSGIITPFLFLYALHDALVKPMRRSLSKMAWPRWRLPIPGACASVSSARGRTS
jgi:hypothetical protein